MAKFCRACMYALAGETQLEVGDIIVENQECCERQVRKENCSSWETLECDVRKHGRYWFLDLPSGEIAFAQRLKDLVGWANDRDGGKEVEFIYLNEREEEMNEKYRKSKVVDTILMEV